MTESKAENQKQTTRKRKRSRPKSPQDEIPATPSAITGKLEPGDDQPQKDVNPLPVYDVDGDRLWVFYALADGSVAVAVHKPGEFYITDGEEAHRLLVTLKTEED